MDFEQVAKERYSCRNFLPKEVEQEKIEKILEMARIAPTAKNLQPFKIYILKSEESLKKLDSVTDCRYGAPLVFFLTYNKKEQWENPFEKDIHSGVEDVSIVATHMMLEAKNLGLESVWCNWYPNTKLEKLLNIPEDERSVLFLAVGYGDAKPSPLHDKKKDIKKLVQYL